MDEKDLHFVGSEKAARAGVVAMTEAEGIVGRCYDLMPVLTAINKAQAVETQAVELSRGQIPGTVVVHRRKGGGFLGLMHE